ncbi:MAG TPA: hypothetical protein VE993_10260 [Stellaceae bacterium]|nr:hypothetical protein [Stellaceae bacterium]
MKLNSALVERTIDQFEADPIPEQHPAIPQLNQVFGDHTFFIDGAGLHIVEPGEPNAAGDPTGTVLRVARWSDDSHTSLVPQQPEPTGAVVVFDSAKPDGAA